MKPTFFRVRDDHNYSQRRFPWGHAVYGTLDAEIPQRACSACGRGFRTRYAGRLSVCTEYGREWSDVIGTSGNTVGFLISERVLSGLRDAGIDSFEYFEVEIAEVRSQRLRVLPQPRYYYISPTGRIDIDPVRTEFKLRVLGTCGECARLLFESIPPELSPDRWIPDRWIPKLDTWDGSHLLQFGNISGSDVLCTERVLLLAREHRWTNFRFQPVDISRRDSIRWRGIDYLGKKWPPDWYPAPASQGKNAAEWATQLRSRDPELHWAAIEALQELREEAIPALVPLLDADDERLRLDSARLLLYYEVEQIEVAESILDRCRAVVAPLSQAK
ncbi:MAG: HEAT repeat domain-containing protein [Pirellulales bacterium]|nr:HEAT repeat domain-containing protein [Pirellulales bacterium]